MGIHTAADYRRWFPDISGELAVAAGTGDTTLVTGRTGHTIFIQQISFFVTTDAAQSMSFEDSSGKQIFNIPASPGDDSHWGQDWGDEGMPLTEAANFLMNVSAAGLAGQLKWVGYIRPTAAARTLSQI